jgi:hypothetical protein
MKPGMHDLTPIDLDTIHKALNGVDLRDYVAEVVWLCEKLGLDDPSWFAEERIRERVNQYHFGPPSDLAEPAY